MKEQAQQLKPNKSRNNLIPEVTLKLARNHNNIFYLSSRPDQFQTKFISSEQEGTRGRVEEGSVEGTTEGINYNTRSKEQ